MPSFKCACQAILLCFAATVGIAGQASAQVKPFPVVDVLPTDADRKTWEALKSRYRELQTAGAPDFAAAREELFAATAEILGKIKPTRGPFPGAHSVCLDMLGRWHSTTGVVAPSPQSMKGQPARVVFSIDASINCNVAAHAKVKELVPAYGAMMADDVREIAVTTGSTRPDFVCVNEKDRAYSNRWFPGGFGHDQWKEIRPTYEQCALALKPVIDVNVAAAKARREAAERESQRQAEENWKEFKRKQEEERLERHARHHASVAAGSAKGPELATLAVASLRKDAPIPDFGTICSEAERRTRPAGDLDYHEGVALDSCRNAVSGKIRAVVAERLAPVIEKALREVPRTPEAIASARLGELPEDVRKSVGYPVTWIAQDIYKAAFKDVLFDNLRQVEKLVEAAYAGKVRLDASIVQAQRTYCKRSWTNDPAVNRAFEDRCVELDTEFMAVACKHALKSASSKVLGHSNTLVALSGKANAREFDLDKLVCAASIDGFTVEVASGFFSSTRLVVASATFPRNKVEVVLEKGEREGRPVWNASELTTPKGGFETGYDVLSCLQKPFKERGMEVILKAIPVLGTDHPYPDKEVAFFNAIANHSACGTIKREWLASPLP